MKSELDEKQSIFLDDIDNSEKLKAGQWISKKSAIMVMHGIGNQKPFETLDTFARGMMETFISAGFDKSDFMLEHKLAKHDTGKGGSWYDNFIRVTYKSSENYLDFYEFYWAPETEDKVSMLDTQEWVQDLASGAKKFYQDQKNLGQTHNDKSFFFDKNGDFREKRYKWTIKVATMFIPFFMLLIEKLVNTVRYLPFIGSLLYTRAKSLKKSQLQVLSNIVGDVVAYNSPDPKNKLFEVRRSIQKRAYAALKYLIEPIGEEKPVYQYDRVVIAAHSLGTQVAFDALNSVNRRLSLNKVKGIDSEGNLTDNEGETKHISDLLCGFVTFGSHLDKAAFFFREHNEQNTYFKQQIRQHFYCFKQKQWSFDTPPFKLHSPMKRYLEDIEWRNYYDANDPVSGHLDYYKDVININCDFTNKAKTLSNQDQTSFISYLGHIYPFTHSYYWKEKRMYGDIIVRYLL